MNSANKNKYLPYKNLLFLMSTELCGKQLFQKLAFLDKKIKKLTRKQFTARKPRCVLYSEEYSLLIAHNLLDM